MGRNSFAATSAVAAVPAGMLAYIIVWYGLMKNSDKLSASLPLMIFSLLVLVVSVFVVVIPFGILLFGGSKKKKVVADKPAKDKAGVEAEPSMAVMATAESEGDVDVLQTSGEAMIVDAEDDDAIVMDDDEIDATTAFTTPASGNDLDVSDEEEIIEAVDLDDFAEIDEISDEVILEDDEDDTPKKKRR